MLFTSVDMIQNFGRMRNCRVTVNDIEMIENQTGD